MLQQILKDMWVDPEILAELDDDQKQTLFCKMREEQVRRWRQWDQKLNQQEQSGVKSTSKTTTKTGKPRKNVNFMLDVDGEPWTWVMGEHENDRTIEEILLEEAKELARKQAEKEAEELRKKVEALTEYIDLTPNKIEDFDTCEKDSLEIDDSMEIYCSVDELREKINKKPLKKTMNNYTFNNYQSRNMVTFNNMNNLVNNDKRDILNELSLNTPVKVSQKVALWEKRVMEERTSEIFKKIQKKQLEAAKEAEECERVQEHLWKEQERKAKEAEQKIREIARRAREEHRRTSALENQDSEPYSEVPLSGAKPPGKQAVIEWYRVSEIPRKAGIEDRDQPAPWFHGLIDRQEAELLLSNKPEGNFLVRISERIWGYAISYKAADRCKHYLVDASSGHYQFLGANQIAHETLGDLIKYHSQHVITEVGGEKLLYPCPRNGDPAILKGVFR